MIKIRYDLIESIHSKTFHETQIFDTYWDIFNHPTVDHKVQCYMPLCTKDYNKLVYVVKDKSSKHPKMIKFIPQFQSRKLILEVEKEKDTFFYTSIELERKKDNICCDGMVVDL